MTVSFDLCALISSQMGELFACLPKDDFVRIRTPFLYPDGDVIDLFAIGNIDNLQISDFGETLHWLQMQAASDRRTKKQRQIMQDVCLTHGVEFFEGTLFARVRNLDDLASVVTRLAQAVLRVADVWFTFRTRAFESLTDEVEEFLVEKEIEYVRGEQLLGRSGRAWRVDFHTRRPRRSSLVAVLSTGSRAAARGVSEHVLATWYDLSHLRVGPEALGFVSLFDDTEDVWAPEDFRLVQEFSQIAYWSRPDTFLELVA